MVYTRIANLGNNILVKTEKKYLFNFYNDFESHESRKEYYLKNLDRIIN